ncbi:MAG: hypothetical protein HOB98_06080 [Gammaproteobacteria bacterium]|nr:hypothetical protein [Gammaproteobacteria bacterium]MBT3866331.1 hypothetical protein [Gammaproteobacteria bacterium]MBT4378539.1 hypothetical protein [Gammaproteobacteria bacterium]MBT4616002.1 hypothetical protein [Gammaproteobacteria bacterium]MBT5199525.1 hypothetical protein [Gammaproteobacteria bacterium]
MELHGAHGYILCQFFSEETNRREDEYGCSLQNRYRILEEIIDGVRHNCRQDFQLGVRLFPKGVVSKQRKRQRWLSAT